MRVSTFAIAAGVTLVATTQSGLAEKKYGPGVSDTEIKLGQSAPYSGPASAYGEIGRAHV